ncbi:ankyrin repeat domain-containing protein [Aquimonas voraii]|uniref:ankyrin repeat domain-containing protein n=1 Tax=Aquimonas voraii TaxID=265719 RepID=UPI003CCC11D0
MPPARGLTQALDLDVTLAKFFNACSTGKHEAVASFLASGVDPKQRDSNHLTGLIWAGRKGHVGVARVLLDHGAALETGDIRLRTALFHAAKSPGSGLAL